MFKVTFTITLVILLWLVSPIILNKVVFPFVEIDILNVSSVYTAVAALFSALAFAALLLTLWLQNQQLNIQRKELELTREDNEKNTQIAAYTALLTYYGTGNHYEAVACELTPMDIAKRLNKLLAKPERVNN